MIITEGSTNLSVPFYFVDDVAGTAPGEPTTGLLFSDIDTGGSASYQRQGAARVDIPAVTIASATTPHNDGSFILIDDTEMPGVYRFDLPDAAVAAGVDFVIVYLRAAAANNTITRPLKIDLTSVDLRDAVRGGMTSLPAAAADAAGGLAISDAGGLDLDAVLSGNIPQTADHTASVAAILVDTGTTLQAELDAIQAAVITNATGVDIAADIIALKAETVLIVADTSELQTDNVPGLIATAQSDLDIITGLSGVNLLTATQASIDAIESDTSTTLDTNLNALIATVGVAGAGLNDVTLNAASIDLVWDETLAGHVTADTAGLLLNDWQDGGRLDLLLDAIPTTAMRGTDSADVLTQVNAALNEAIAELGVGAPTATPTLRTGLMLLYHALAFKTVVQTSGTDALEIYNSAGTMIAKKLLSDDTADYTEAKTISG